MANDVPDQNETASEEVVKADEAEQTEDAQFGDEGDQPVIEPPILADIATLNPDEIDTVEELKDALAALHQANTALANENLAQAQEIARLQGETRVISDGAETGKPGTVTEPGLRQTENFRVEAKEVNGLLQTVVSTTGWVGPPQLQFVASRTGELRDALSALLD